MCAFFCNDSEEEGSEKGRVSGVSSRPEDPPDLILSIGKCNECEFFGLDSDQDVCTSLVSLFLLVSTPVVAVCEIMERRCAEQEVGQI